jgi:predicted RNA methylase
MPKRCIAHGVGTKMYQIHKKVSLSRLPLRSVGIGFASSALDATVPQVVVNDGHQKELGQFIPAVYHFNMLADDLRMRGFKEAIAVTVRPGHRVLELGGGTGVLSFFAAMAGAEVTCVEKNPELVRRARAFLHSNAMEDRVTVVQADAFDYLPHHPVDVVICEMIHVGMLREKQLLVIDSFKRRYLRAFGPPLPQFIPEGFFQAVQPVQQCYDFHGYWAPVVLFQDPVVEQPRTVVLGQPTVYHSGTYCQDYSLDCSWNGPLEFSAAGVFNAIRLITKNVLTVIEAERRTVDWTSQYLVVPVDLPLAREQGDISELSFSYQAGDLIETLLPKVAEPQPWPLRKEA